MYFLIWYFINFKEKIIKVKVVYKKKDVSKLCCVIFCYRYYLSLFGKFKVIIGYIEIDFNFGVCNVSVFDGIVRVCVLFIDVF